MNNEKIIMRQSKGYMLILQTENEMKIAQEIALENNTSGLAFSCLSQDNDSITDICLLLEDSDITAALFETFTGDYEPLYVRYGYPSFRHDEKSWYKVVWLMKGKG